MSSASDSQACRICQSGLETLLEFGPQPICNRFLEDAESTAPQHPLDVVLCEQCGTVQLKDPAPAELIRPPSPMLYREPERHLDTVVDDILKVSSGGRFLGLTYKDEPLLERLQVRGHADCTLIDLARDLGIEDPAAGIETVAEAVSRGSLADFTVQHGTFDVVFARHIAEHAHDFRAFLSELQKLMSPNGFLVLEVPDCTTAIRTRDYTTFWEEHLCYFTPSTFERACSMHGLATRGLAVHEYLLENALVAILQPTTRSEVVSVDRAELEVARRFAGGFSERAQECRRRLEQYVSRGASVAVLGAGHNAITFVNLLGIADLITFVADDSPQKCGRWMPGSGLPIRPCADLVEQKIQLCLLAVAPESVERVVERNASFLEQGGRFASIHPVGPRSFWESE